MIPLTGFIYIIFIRIIIMYEHITGLLISEIFHINIRCWV